MTKEILCKYPAWLRAIHLWFHGAHHTTRGVGFAGDHAELYDRVYTEVQGEIDGAVEKVIGLYNDEKLACPKCITSKALQILDQYASPAEVEADKIPVVGGQMIKDYLNYLQNTVEHLERSGKLTMGLDDQLYSSANTHETYVYLLNQRAKINR
jgi:DNA-binding ferritin-like protein